MKLCIHFVQSSIDPLLAAEALVAGIVVSSVLSISANRKVVRSFCKWVYQPFIYLNSPIYYHYIFVPTIFWFLFSPCNITKKKNLRKLNGLSKINRGEPRDPYSSPVTNSSASRPFTRSPYTSPVQGRLCLKIKCSWLQSLSMTYSLHASPSFQVQSVNRLPGCQIQRLSILHSTKLLNEENSQRANGNRSQKRPHAKPWKGSSLHQILANGPSPMQIG